MHDPWILTFTTTHHALWAEELARSAGVAVVVIPAPPAARARCDLALEVEEAAYPGLVAVLEAEGVPFAAAPAG